MALGAGELGSFLIVALLIIAGIYFLSTKGKSSRKLVSGIICTVLGGLVLLILLVYWITSVIR